MLNKEDFKYDIYFHDSSSDQYFVDIRILYDYLEKNLFKK
mgnify:CR=1 FL=1